MKFVHELRKVRSQLRMTGVKYKPVEVFEYTERLVDRGEASELLEHIRLGEAVRITPDAFTDAADLPTVNVEVKSWGATLVKLDDGETLLEGIERWERTIYADAVWFVDWIDNVDTLRVYEFTIKEFAAWMRGNRCSKLDHDSETGEPKVRVWDRTSYALANFNHRKER